MSRAGPQEWAGSGERGKQRTAVWAQTPIHISFKFKGFNAAHIMQLTFLPSCSLNLIFAINDSTHTSCNHWTQIMFFPPRLVCLSKDLLEGTLLSGVIPPRVSFYYSLLIWITHLCVWTEIDFQSDRRQRAARSNVQPRHRFLSGGKHSREQLLVARW